MGDIPKDTLLIIDHSASISPTKLSQFKAGAIESLSYLNPNDRFNVVSFTSKAQALYPNLVAATEQNRETASLYIQRLVRGGQTDVFGGIGPFVPHKDTIYRDCPHGSLRTTLILLSVIRLMNPSILLPATTALGTIDKNGRELGILHGANVVMPNLSPQEHRAEYSLYDNKISTGEEAAESVALLAEKLKAIGYEIAVGRGDYQHKTN